jgi:hypothetical protein
VQTGAVVTCPVSCLASHCGGALEPSSRPTRLGFAAGPGEKDESAPKGRKRGTPRSRFEDQRYAKQQSGFPFSYFPSSEKKEKDRTARWTG